MSTLRTFAETRPFFFVIALAIVFPVLAIPFVAAFKIAGQDIVPLRLLIPLVQSVFILWLIRWLGWQARAGLTGRVENVQLYWYPALVAFAPVLLYGTVEISWGWIVFYGAALVFTGLSEEAFARGVAIPALMRYGKWRAVLIAAAIFSAGHITNIFFEEFGALEWADKFMATFGFAVLYGALFLRTGSLWPLVALHAVHDFSYLTSGTAGPFLVTPIDPLVHMLLSLANVAYGVYILSGVVPTPAGQDRPAGARSRA